jgi:hypothetical protein
VEPTEPTGSTEPRFELRIEGEREELLRRLAAALALLTPRAKSVRVIRGVAVGLIVFGALIAVAVPSGGIVLGSVFMGSGTVYLLLFTKAAIVRRTLPALRRNQFLGLPCTWVAEADGLRMLSPTFCSWMAWSRFRGVLEHRDGLLVVGRGGLSGVNFPASVFLLPDAPPRHLVFQWVAAWIAQAEAPQHVPPTAPVLPPPPLLPPPPPS